MEQLRRSIKLSRYQSPHNPERVYHLFNCHPDNKILCPVVRFEAIVSIQKKIYSDSTEENVPEDITWEPHQSTEFVSIYNCLKKMEPYRRQELSRQLTQNVNTIKQVFGYMTENLTKSFSQPLHLDLDLSENLLEEKSKPSLFKQITTVFSRKKMADVPKFSQSAKDKSRQLSFIQKVTTKFSRKPKFLDEVHLSEDMAKVWYARKEGMVSEDDIISAFFVRRSLSKPQNLIAIMVERSMLTSAQCRQLETIPMQKISRPLPRQSNKDLQFCHFILDYQVLSPQDIQSLLHMQLELKKLGISQTLESLLITGKIIDPDMVRLLAAQCRMKIENRQSEADELETRNIENVATQGNTDKKIAKKLALRTHPLISRTYPGRNILLQIAAFSFLLWALYWFAGSLQAPIISPQTNLIAEEKSPISKATSINKIPQKATTPQPQKTPARKAPVKIPQVPEVLQVFFDKHKRQISIKVHPRSPVPGNLIICKNGKAISSQINFDKKENFSTVYPVIYGGIYEIILTLGDQKKEIYLPVPPSDEDFGRRAMAHIVNRFIQTISMWQNNLEQAVKTRNLGFYSENAELWQTMWQQHTNSWEQEIPSNAKIIQKQIAILRLGVAKMTLIMKGVDNYWQQQKTISESSFLSILQKLGWNKEYLQIIKSWQVMQKQNQIDH